MTPPTASWDSPRAARARPRSPRCPASSTTTAVSTWTRAGRSSTAKPAMDAVRFYGKMLANYGPQGSTSLSWENIMPLFQAGKVAMWTDASVFYGQIVDPAKSQIPAESVGIATFPAGPEREHPVHRRLLGNGNGQAVQEQGRRHEVPHLGDGQGPREARDARQHHHGTLVGLDRSRDPGEDEQGPGRHPRVRREERVPVRPAVHERRRRGARPHRRADHRLHQLRGRRAGPGQEGAAKWRPRSTSSSRTREKPDSRA